MKLIIVKILYLLGSFFLTCYLENLFSMRMGSMQSLLNIVVALHCEAKPLIRFYRLKKITPTAQQKIPYSLFTNNDNSIYLIISGVGKIKMAAATAFLYFFTGGKSWATFLNIGIAGSAAIPIGEAILANKITEFSTTRHAYPFIPFKKFAQCHLTTYDLPHCEFPFGMIDMEGSAFFQVATSYVTQEQVQVLKIISDGPEKSYDYLNEKIVTDLIENRLDKIQEICDYLMILSKQERALEFDSSMLYPFQNAWHFTHSQILQLKDYLRRWFSLLGNENPFQFCQHEKNADLVINKIKSKLDFTMNN